MNIEDIYKKPPHAELVPYIRQIEPPLRHEELFTDLVRGDNRYGLRIHTTGDWSLVVGYKGRAAHVTSVSDVLAHYDDLSIVQFQGAKGRTGYRLATGFNITAFVANQLLAIANHPETRYERITMPKLSEIKGMEDVEEEGRDRYKGLVAMLDMCFSDEEDLFVRDLEFKKRLEFTDEELEVLYPTQEERLEWAMHGYPEL